MWQLLTALALVGVEPPVQPIDPPKPMTPAVQADQFREGHAASLKGLRENRERLAPTLGSRHPLMEELDEQIKSREVYLDAYDQLKSKLDQRKAEVRDLEAQLNRLINREAAETAQSPKPAGPTVEQKLDAILRRLDLMERRLSDVEKAKRQ
jgi:ABC-type transporter Mla subunit MlaD